MIWGGILFAAGLAVGWWIGFRHGESQERWREVEGGNVRSDQ